MPKAVELPDPPVVERDGFQLTNGRFSVADGDVERVEGARLKALFDPGSLPREKDRRKARRASKELFSKSFFAAQLRHYGLEIPPDSSGPQLFTLLADAVEEGKCDQVPDSVLELRRSMARDLEPLQRKWERDVETARRQQAEAAFQKCKTPGERALCDADLFLEYYFLTDGQPDPSKTPEPLALYGFGQGFDRLLAFDLTKKVPGLEVAISLAEDEGTPCVGWDLAAVMDMVNRMNEEASRLEKERQEAKWEKDMEAHRTYISRPRRATASAPQGEGAEKEERPPFTLEHCRGSYIMKCDSVRECWPHIKETYTLDVGRGSDGMLFATFHFGVIEGTMVLSLSNETLDVFAPLDSDGSDDPYATDDADDADEGWNNDGVESLSDNDNEESQTDENHKRTAGEAFHPNATEEETPPAKRPRIEPAANTHRVYYRMDGCETGEGEPFPELAAGHLDFTLDEDRAVKFVGLADSFPFHEDDVAFEGYKVSDRPKKKVNPWDFRL